MPNSGAGIWLNPRPKEPTFSTVAFLLVESALFVTKVKVVKLVILLTRTVSPTLYPELPASVTVRISPTKRELVLADVAVATPPEKSRSVIGIGVG